MVSLVQLDEKGIKSKRESGADIERDGEFAEPAFRGRSKLSLRAGCGWNMETCSPQRVLTVRQATLEDIPRLVELGRQFRDESTYSAFLADNPAKMAELGKSLLSKGGLLCGEHDGEIVAMLGFIIHDHFIDGERLAGEVFWYVLPEHRGEGLKLVDEAKRRAKLAGAKALDMIAPTKRVARLYDHLGYEFVESSHRIKL